MSEKKITLTFNLITFLFLSVLIGLGLSAVELHEYITYPCKDYFCNSLNNTNLDEKFKLCCIKNNSLSRYNNEMPTLQI